MRPDDPYRRNPIYFCSQMLVRLSLGTLFDVTYYGVENVPTDGAAILAANHQSFLDPPLVGAPIRRPVSFMAKSELFDNKFFGWAISRVGAFPVRQGKGDRAAIVEAVNRLKAGHLLYLNPEGARCEDGEIAPFQSGLSLLVRRGGVPVVPIVIDGSFIAWPRTAKIFRPTPIKVMYGRPLALQGLSATEITRVVESRTREMFTELRAFPIGATGSPTYVAK